MQVLRPLTFERNDGQFGEGSKFGVRIRDHAMTLHHDGIRIWLPLGNGQQAPLDLQLMGHNSQAKIAGVGAVIARSNYFIGRDPRKWKVEVPHFERIQHENVYPGIDLIYYGKDSSVEFDFVVSPEANPQNIRLRIGTHNRVKLSNGGDLLVETASGELRLNRPIAYQEESGTRKPVIADFVLEGREVGLQLGKYDPSKKLVVDPVLNYSTFLGGASNIDVGLAIAVDPQGNTYVAGQTSSTNFPTQGALQGGLRGSADIFVSKINAAGTAVIFSTFIGGSDFDAASGIALDNSGNIYLAGGTSSPDFPTVNPFQASPGGGVCSGAPCSDAVLLKLNSSGNALVYSTYLGGNNQEHAWGGVVVDQAGNAYIAGQTLSTNFPVFSAFQNALAPGGTCRDIANQVIPCPDAYIAKLDASGRNLIYSTYLGGSELEGAEGLALDPVGSVYITGVTTSSNFPTLNAAQPQFGGGQCPVSCANAFVAKLTPNGQSLSYATYLGGLSDVATGLAIAADSTGNAYVTGFTGSPTFPVLNALQSLYSGVPFDAFLTKLNTSGALAYSTFLGGNGDDRGWGIGVDSGGRAHVAGLAGSTNFPTMNPFQPSNAGDGDGFLASFNPSGTSLSPATFLGGGDFDQALAIALDTAGSAYISGITTSANFPVTPGVLQPSFAGPICPPNVGGNCGDAFVLKVAVDNPVMALSVPTLSFNPQIVGTQTSHQSVTLTNVGGSILNLTSVSASGDFTVSHTCGSSLSAGATCTVAAVFSPTSTGQRTGTVTFVSNAPGSPHTVGLTGTGIDFSLSGTPTSNTITAGQTASFTVNVDPVSGFNQPVALGCSGAPSATTCSIAPGSVQANGVSPASATVTITTTARSSVPPVARYRSPYEPFVLLLIALCLLGISTARGYWKPQVRVAAERMAHALAILLLVALAASCGGGGGGSPTPPAPRPPGTPAGTYSLTITGSAGSVNRTTSLTLVVQ